ncbi:minor capsid protein, partial [Blautia pseudococcoides]|nr:minor capsid protein [Blautia pseudococcoides]
KCEPFVPKLGGDLRDSARVNRKSVSWDTPYARRQFYEHKSKSMWHIKMWRDRGKEIVDSVAQFCDCRVKR